LPFPRLHAGAFCALLACLGCALFAPSALAAPVSRADAQRAALAALRARRGSAPLIVFRGAAPLKPGTRVAIAGVERLQRQADASAARSRDALLRAAGVSVIRAPLAARVGREPAWFFYADEGPFQAYQHPGRVVLVGQRSGRVTVTRRFSWPPLLDGRLPAFLRSYAGYRDPRARAFTRLWRPERPQAKAGPAAAGTGALAPLGGVGALAAAPRAAAAPAPAIDAERRAAAALAAERSCAVRVGDTLGNFYDASSFDRTRAQFGALFNRLARLDRGFLSVRYRVASGTSLQRYVERLIVQRGCADVFLYVAGGGYVHGGEPAVSVGVQGRRDGRLEQHVVTATTLRRLIGSNPGATFKLLLDAPGSGAFLAPLSDLPNLLLVLTSARAGQGSFTALPGLVALDGSQLGNGYNRDGLLEFSNRGLRGLGCFLAAPTEVDAAIAAQAQGLTRSFLVWMLRRAYALCGEGSLAAIVPGAPAPVLRTPGTTVVPPAEVPPVPPVPPPGPKNATPVAAPVAVTTAEDTPVTVTLAGSDPDGDPLLYTAAAPVPAGTVSGGEGPIRTFTPAPDFNGTATFQYVVSDGRASATATVTVTVTPVDDPPVLDPGPGTTAFADGDPPVAVAPQLTAADVDDATLDRATVTIAGGCDAGADVLRFTDQRGIAGTWDVATATLRLTGTATLADYEAALRSITFETPGRTPSEAPRTVRFVVANGAESAPADRTVTVIDRNEPPVLGGAGGTVTWTEGDGAPVAVLPGLTVADEDDATLASATVALGAGFVAGEDELVFADQRGIAGSWNGQAGVLRLTGAASLADWQAALRTVAYRNTGGDAPTAGDRAVTVRVSDGADESAPAGATVRVLAVPDPPVLGGAGGTVAYTENDPATAIAPALTVADSDSATLASATVTISGGFVAGEDELVFADQRGITGSWNGQTGVLRLTGTASLADWQAALRTVAYRNGSDDPSTAARTISFVVHDGEEPSDPVTASVTVTAVNDAPRLTAGGGAPTYIEGDATGVVVDPGLTVADPDGTTLASATVRIASGYDPAGDELTLTAGGGITGAWDPASGTLTLTGPAGLAAFQTVLRSVRFRHTGADPAPGSRTISFVADDGGAASAAVTTTVAFDLVDDPPVVDPGSGTTTWGGADVAVAPALTVADPDSPTLTGATVQLTGGYAAAEDQLLFTDQRGIAGSWDALTGTLTLTGSASLADWQAALRTVAYHRTAPFLDDGRRTITFTVANARRSAGVATSLIFGRSPVLSGLGAGLSYTEDDPARAIAPNAAVTDPDSSELTGATAEITAGYVAGEDVLSAGTAGTAIDATVSGAIVTLTGADTLAHYQQVLRSIAYRNASKDPSTATRTVTYTVTDGLFTDSGTTTIAVTAVNDAPILSIGAGTTTYTEDGPAVAVADDLTVTDYDDVWMTGAKVQITAGLIAAEDRLELTSGGGIATTWDQASGTLTLSGRASPATYQAALRAVTYRNAETVAPTTAARTVSFTITDEGGATSAAATKQVAVRAVNDPPQISSGATLAYTENDPATAIDPALSLSDGDSPNLAGATVALSAGHAAGEDELRFVNQNGITGSFDRAAGTLTLSGSASVAAYRTALRSVAYLNTSEDPSETPRTVTFTVDDGADTDATASTTATITVTAVNDAPTVGDIAVSATGNTPLFAGTTAPAGLPARTLTGAANNVLTSAADVDGPGPLRVDVAGSSIVGDRGGRVTWNADGTFTYRPAPGITGTEQLTFRVTDQGSPAQTATGHVTVAVTDRVFYVDNTAADGGDGTAERPYATLALADYAASIAGDTIYLRRGDGSGAGMSGGATLIDGQRLLGPREPLSAGGAQLHPGDPSAPRIPIAGTVSVLAGTTVAGVEIAASAGRPALTTGSAVAGGTFRDLALTGASGGLALSGTSGTWTVGNVAIATSGGTAISLANAGTVAFGSGVSVDATGGAALGFQGTTTSGTIASVRLTDGAASDPAISIATGRGTLALPSVDVTTAGAGIVLAGSEGIVVGAGGSSKVVAGQTAVATSLPTGLASPPSIMLQRATSTGGATGLSLAGGGATGVVSIESGTLSGQTTAALSVDGGSAGVDYGGSIGDGSGLSVKVANRTGGTVDVRGSIADGSDAGGGIQLTGNSGGRTTFSGSSIALETGAQPAVSIAATGGHAVAFTGGALVARATTGDAFAASGSTAGSVTVTGSGNRLTSAGGTALKLAGPQIGAAGLTFASISSNGGPNGISLAGTGTGAGLHVTGSGSAASGGTIQNAAGDGIRLTDVADIQLASVKVIGARDDGIHGDGVRGFALTGASEVTGSGDGAGDSGVELSRLSGTVTIDAATVTGSRFRALDVAAAPGLDMSVTGGTYGGASVAAPTDDDGIHVEADSGSARVALSGLTVSHVGGDHVQTTSSAGSTATATVSLASSQLTNAVGGSGGGVVVNPGGNGSWNVAVTGTTITGAAGEGITVDTPGSQSDAQPVVLGVRLIGNRIGAAAVAGSGSANGNGIGIRSNGAASVKAVVSGNVVTRYRAAGIMLLQNDGSGRLDATVDDNDLNAPDGATAFGVTATSGGAGTADTGTLCLDLGRQQPNRLGGAAAPGLDAVRVRQRDQTAFRLPGYGGAARDTNAVGAFLAAAQPAVQLAASVEPALGAGFVGGTGCAQP
jgi:Bacterial Ig domain